MRRERRSRLRRSDGSTELFVSRPRLLSVRSASIGGEELSLGELAPSIAGTIVRSTPWPVDVDIEVAYEHGYPEPPNDVREAAIKLAREYVIATAKGRATAGRRTTLRAQLARKARRALRKRKILEVSLAATFADTAGNRSRKNGKGTLKRPRRR